MRPDNFVRYNHWANQQLTNWLKTLEPEWHYKTVQSSFGSIDLTVQHMKNAQSFWLAVITEQDVKNLDETTRQNAFGLNVKELLDSSHQMIKTCTSFTDQQLMDPVASPVMTQPRSDFILHVINHNAYHRGQIVTIARALGIVADIPATDYETFLWFHKDN